MKKIIILMITIFAIILIGTTYSNAEGSRDLVRNAPDNSYRAYLEWQAGNTLRNSKAKFAQSIF